MLPALGAYLAASGGHSPFAGDITLGDIQGERIDLWRVSDGALLMRCRSGGRYLGTMDWSPDGTMLAISVITGFQGYGGECRIYRAGHRVV